MQPRNAAILFLVAAALGAFVYLYEIRGEASRESDERSSRRMFAGVEADAIGFLAFRTRGDQAFEAVRQDASWLIQSPLAFAGDDVSLDAMASTLANLETEASIEDPGAPEIYGLGAAARWIRFRVGSQTHSLGIGSDTPVGGNVYVAKEGANEIYTVPSFRVSSFDRELSDLRDKRVFDFDRTRVDRVVMGWRGGSVTLVRETAGAETGGGWRVAHPSHAEGPADEATIDGLLSALAFLRADDFVDDPTPAIEDEAFLTVRLGLAPVEGDPLEIGLRAVNDPAGDDFLVRSREGTSLFKVARGRLVEMPREVFAYRFKQISDFEVSDAQAFSLEFAAASETRSVEPERVRVERVAQGWKASGANWRPGKAGGLIAELARLEATSVVAEVGGTVDLASLGLQPPRVILRAFGKAEADSADGAPLLAEVELGRSDEGVGIVARARGQQVIYRIDEDLADAIPLDLERYEAKFLAPAAAGASDGPTGVPPVP
jgi:hypothetical protein